MRIRRRFTDKFKRAAVERLAADSIAEVARSSGVSVSVLHRWRKQLAKHSASSAAGERRRFTKEFKESAVRRLEQGESVGEVVRSCQLDPTVLRRWWHEWKRFGEAAFSGYGKARLPARSSLIVIVRFTQEEYERIRTASARSQSSSLPDFVRAQILTAPAAPSVAEIARRLDLLIDRLRRATQSAAQAAAGARSKIRETATATHNTTTQPTTLYQR